MRTQESPECPGTADREVAPAPSSHETTGTRPTLGFCFLLLVLGALLYVAWLGKRDLWYPDEPNLAEVTQAMIRSGDWIVPRHFGEVWLDYPPLTYWAGGLSSLALGGMSAFSLRLPSALASILLVLLTCAAASRWFSPRAGLWAGLLLLASPQFTWQAVGYRPDPLFAMFIGGGIYLYARGAEGRVRWLPRILGFALLGLAVLTKGPLGLLLPGLVLVLWHGSRKEWRRILELIPLSLVALAVALPWYAACARSIGWEKLLHDLYMQNFARYESAVRSHGRPPWYFLTTIWVDFAPFSLLLPFALVRIVKTGARRRREVQLALWWFAGFFVFLSIAATKRQLYLLPAYPAVALLLAPWLAGVGREGGPDPRPARVVSRLLAGVCVIASAAGLGGAVAMDWIFGRFPMDEEMQVALNEARLPLVLTGATALVVGLLVFRSLRKGNVQGALATVTFGVIALLLTVLAFLGPALNPAKTYVPQSRWILSRIGDEPAFGMVTALKSTKKAAAFAFYTGRRVVMLKSDEEISKFFDAHPGSLVLVDEKFSRRLFSRASRDWKGHVTDTVRAARVTYYVLRR